MSSNQPLQCSLALLIAAERVHELTARLLDRLNTLTVGHLASVSGRAARHAGQR